jgi:hypothetical protein
MAVEVVAEVEVMVPSHLVILREWIGRSCALQVCHMLELGERWRFVPAAYFQRSMQHRDWETLSDCTKPQEEFVAGAVDVKQAAALALAVVLAVMPDVVLAVVAVAPAEPLVVDVAQTEMFVAAVVAQVAMLEAVVVVPAVMHVVVVAVQADR